MLQANFTPSRIGTITSLKTTISYFVALFVVFAAAANGVCWPHKMAAKVSSNAAAAQRRICLDSSVEALLWVCLSIQGVASMAADTSSLSQYVFCQRIILVVADAYLNTCFTVQSPLHQAAALVDHFKRPLPNRAIFVFPDKSSVLGKVGAGMASRYIHQMT